MGQALPLRVRIQYWMGQVFYFPLLVWIIVGFKLIGYRIPQKKELRTLYQKLTNTAETPLVICSNHLTYIDSALLISVFGSHFWYCKNFRRHMWNLVASEYAQNPLFRFVCYFSKCLFIDRKRERNRGYPTLDIALELLKRGEPVFVFPEGRRSKTGRFDDEKLAYGVGRLISRLDSCRVLCIYIRSDKQTQSTSFPSPGSKFRVLTELVTFRSSEYPSHPAHAISKDIAARIRRLEAQYFESQPVS